MKSFFTRTNFSFESVEVLLCALEIHEFQVLKSGNTDGVSRKFCAYNFFCWTTLFEEFWQLWIQKFILALVFLALFRKFWLFPKCARQITLRKQITILIIIKKEKSSKWKKCLSVTKITDWTSPSPIWKPSLKCVKKCETFDTNLNHFDKETSIFGDQITSRFDIFGNPNLRFNGFLTFFQRELQY